jgi:hypothetical protein
LIDIVCGSMLKKQSEIERRCVVINKKPSPKPIDAKTVYKAVDIIRAQSQFGHKISQMLVDIADICIHTKRYQNPKPKRRPAA